MQKIHQHFSRFIAVSNFALWINVIATRWKVISANPRLSIQWDSQEDISESPPTSPLLGR